MKFSLCLLTENVLRRETRDSNGALSTTQPNCGLDFSEISEKNRDLDECRSTKKFASTGACCLALTNVSSVTAFSNSQLYLAAITVRDLNFNCRTILANTLRQGNISLQTFSACDTGLLGIVTLEKNNTCPVAYLQDVQKRINLDALASNCSIGEVACSTCFSFIQYASKNLSGDSNDTSVVLDCVKVVYYHLAQQRSSKVADALTYIQLSSFCHTIFPPPKSPQFFPPPPSRRLTSSPPPTNYSENSSHGGSYFYPPSS